MFQARDIDPDNGWNPVEHSVLCFVRDKPQNSLLLIDKKTGLGAGLVNAPGGRIEKGETPAQAAIRETREEVGLNVDNVIHRGNLFFQFVDGHSIHGYIYETVNWSGIPIETREARPFWCRTDAIPFDRMWADDSWWMPGFLAGCFIQGRFVFDGTVMLDMVLEVKAANSGNGIPKNPIKSLC